MDTYCVLQVQAPFSMRSTRRGDPFLNPLFPLPVSGKDYLAVASPLPFTSASLFAAAQKSPFRTFYSTRCFPQPPSLKILKRYSVQTTPRISLPPTAQIVWNCSFFGRPFSLLLLEARVTGAFRYFRSPSPRKREIYSPFSWIAHLYAQPSTLRCKAFCYARRIGVFPPPTRFNRAMQVPTTPLAWKNMFFTRPTDSLPPP